MGQPAIASALPGYWLSRGKTSGIIKVKKPVQGSQLKALKVVKCHSQRLPKRGFNNIFRKDCEVNIGRIQTAIDAGKLDSKKPVDAAMLVAAGVISKARDGVRILAKGELRAKVELHAAGASQSAIAAVKKAGGKIVLPSPVSE